MNICNKCGGKMPADFRFCGHCGASISSLGEFLPALGPEQRLITVLFSDLVGSTALSGRVGPEVYRTVIDHYIETCASAIHRYGGIVAHCEGDGLLALFGYPQAHEDDPFRAVRAALDLLPAMQAMNDHVFRKLDASVQVRIGVHTGLAVIGEMGEGDTFDPMSVTGEAPNFAAKIQSLAEPNSIVVSEAAWRFVSNRISGRFLGSHPVQGVNGFVNVYAPTEIKTAPVWLNSKANNPPDPFFGREEELEKVATAWEQVVSGECKIFLVAGEAGIGKSHFIRAAKDNLSAKKLYTLECFSSPHFEHSAFYPVVELLRKRLRLEHANANVMRRRLRKAVSLNKHGDAQHADLLERLLSARTEIESSSSNFVPEQNKRQTIDLLLSILSHIARTRPTLLVVEDLHWTDPSTLELLDALVNRGPIPGLMCMLSCRPEIDSRWQPPPNVARIDLSRLSTEQSAAMVMAVGGEALIESKLVDQIVYRTDGVPLFIEEMTKMVVATADEGDENFSFALADKEFAQVVPETLQGMLTARLDQLGGVKSIAQLGAAIGREFSYEMIEAISERPKPELIASLERLMDTGLVRIRDGTQTPSYEFRHSLIRDAAYATLLQSTRAKIHRDIADALIQRFPELSERQPELIASHLSEANDSERAVLYWRKAGQKAFKTFANIEAITHFKNALTQASQLPDSTAKDREELEIQKGLAAAFKATEGYAAIETEKAYRRAEELCKNLGASHQDMYEVIGGLISVYQLRGSIRSAYDLTRRLLELANEIGDEEAIRRANRKLGWSLFCLGELAPARVHLEAALTPNPDIKLSDSSISADTETNVIANVNLAWLEWFLGHPEMAKRRSGAARSRSSELGVPLAEAYALCMSAAIYQGLGDRSTTRRLALSVRSLSEKFEFSYWRAWANILYGWSISKQGKYKEGLSTIESGLSEYRTTGAELFRPYAMALMAELYLEMGDAQRALDCIAEGLVSSSANDMHFYDAELYRLRGEAQTQLSFDLEKADASFVQAIELARNQGALTLLLRSLTSRANSSRPHRKSDCLKDLIDIFDKISEGFDTPDFIRAQSLIESQSALVKKGV